MPNRIVRDGILRSASVCSLNWAAEVFYRRLHSIVDDYGRYEADVVLLRSACYPRQIDKVSDSDIGKWLAQVAEAGLVRVYPAKDGKRYLEVVKFDQRIRTESKCPSPESAVSVECQTNDGQMRANDGLGVCVVVCEGEGVDAPPSGAKSPPKDRKQQKRPMPSDFGISDRVRSWAAEKGHARLDQHLESFKAKCAANGYRYADWDAAFMEAIRGNWAKLNARDVPSQQKSTERTREEMAAIRREKVVNEPVAMAGILANLGLSGGGT